MSTPPRREPRISVAQLWPRTSTRSPAPSSPRLWRRISAPVSWRSSARSARAAAACSRSTRSTSTHPLRERTRGRACLASRATSAAVSSTSSNSTDHDTLLSWWAPTTVSDDSATSRSIGVALRRDMIGTRTSNPMAASVGPVVVINSQAWSWVNANWPRRDPVDRPMDGNARPRRSHSAVTVRPPRSWRRAPSMGTGGPPPVAARIETSHTPASPGASSCTINFGRDADVTPRVHRSRAWATSSMNRLGPWNGEPSIPAITASCTSRGEITDGGAAGSSIRSTPSATIASTTAVRTAMVVARPLSRPMDRDGSWHGGRQGSDGRGVHERRPPPHLGRDLRSAWTGAHSQRRHDRPRCREANTLVGDPSEPAQAGPDLVGTVTGPDRHEPSERVRQRDGMAVGRRTAREANTRMGLPPHRRRAGRLEPRRDLVVRLGRMARSAGPDDDACRPTTMPAARPRPAPLHEERRHRATPAAATSVDADERRRCGGSAPSR